MRYWKRAIQLAVDVGCDTMNSEFNGTPRGGRPERGPVLAVDGGAPADLRARGHPARTRGRTRTTSSRRNARRSTWSGGSTAPTSGTSSAPRTPSTWATTSDGDDRVRGAGPGPGPRRRRLDHTGVVRAALHRQPAGLAGPVHQHLDIGQGEVDFEAVLRRPRRIGFDGILTPASSPGRSGPSSLRASCSSGSAHTSTGRPQPPDRGVAATA